MSQHLRFGALATLVATTALPAQARVDADDALQALIAGNRRFASGNVLPQPLSEGTRRTLARGQAPYAIVVTTTDSRVVPEHIFNVGLGELYVVRIAGNVCDPATLASVEYAAESLGAPLCIVLGHDSASELFAMPKDSAETPGLARIAARLRPALQRAESEGLDGDPLLVRAAEENVHETVAECLRRSSVLRELTRLEHLRFVPAMYSLMRGDVSFLPPRPSRDLLTEKQRRDGPPRPRQAGLPPHVALSLLQAGHRRFLAGTNGLADVSPARRHALMAAQRPFAIVLTDADSRLAPEHVFDTGLGDIAVVRVGACALDDEVLGSVEHLVREFGPGLLLVVAAEPCGITEYVLRHGNGPHLTPSLRSVAEWLEPSILQAKHEGGTGAALGHATVRHNVQRVVREARLRSPILRRLEQRGQLGILGAVYRLVDGEIEWQRDAPATRIGEDVASLVDQQHRPTHGGEFAAPGDEPAPHARGYQEDHAGPGAHGDDHDHRDAHDDDPAHAAPGDPLAASSTDANQQAAPPTIRSTLVISLLVAIIGVLGAYTLMQIGQRRAAKRMA